MALKTILILTAGFGEGHNAAARNLANAIRSSHPDAIVHVEDIFADAYGPLNRISQFGYLTLINRCPGLWSHMFEWLDKTKVVKSRIGIFGRAVRLIRNRLKDLRPDIIVSTYPGYNHLLDTLHKGSPDRAYTMVTVVTDSITVNSVWLNAHSDWFLVANPETAEVMKAKGVPNDKIRVTGFPVPDAFVDLKIQHTPPANGAPWKVLFMVNSGKFVAVDILEHLIKLNGVSLTVTVGRDNILQQRLAKIAAKSPTKIEIFGWTDRLSELMATNHIVISKAGGATVQECIAAGTPMIVSQIVPGQEEGNARLIDESGSGTIATTSTTICDAINQAIANDGKLWKSWDQSIDTLSKPKASRRIAEWLLALDQKQPANP